MSDPSGFDIKSVVEMEGFKIMTTEAVHVTNIWSIFDYKAKIDKIPMSACPLFIGKVQLFAMESIVGYSRKV